MSLAEVTFFYDDQKRQVKDQDSIRDAILHYNKLSDPPREYSTTIPEGTLTLIREGMLVDGPSKFIWSVETVINVMLNGKKIYHKGVTYKQLKHTLVNRVWDRVY